MTHLYINPKFAGHRFDPTEDFLLFLHAQRTGGSALRHAIARAWSREDLYCTQFVDKFKHWHVVEQETLAPFKGFAGHSNYAERDFDRNVLMITLLRHPVMRIISLYYYVRGRDNHALNAQAKAMDLGEFYRTVRLEKKTYFDNVMCRRICGKPNFKMAKERIETDFWMVGMNEHLGEFVTALLDGLGEPQEELPLLKSDADRYAEELKDSELVAEIRENNNHDIKLFDYMNETYFNSRYAYP